MKKLSDLTIKRVSLVLTSSKCWLRESIILELSDIIMEVIIKQFHQHGPMVVITKGLKVFAIKFQLTVEIADVDSSTS